MVVLVWLPVVMIKPWIINQFGEGKGLFHLNRLQSIAEGHLGRSWLLKSGRNAACWLAGFQACVELDLSYTTVGGAPLHQLAIKKIPQRHANGLI